MAIFQSYLGLAVMAMMLAAIHGHFIPGAYSDVFSRDLASKGKLFRQLRDVMTNETDAGPDVHSDLCMGVFSCITENGHFAFLNHVMEFDFEEVASGLSTQCENPSGFTCDLDRCTHLHDIVEFTNRILELVCDEEEGFQDGTGSSCWSSEFKSGMQQCTMNHASNARNDPAFGDLPACFASVTRDLPDCTDHDKEFVASLTNEMMSIMRDVDMLK